MSGPTPNARMHWSTRNRWWFLLAFGAYVFAVVAITGIVSVALYHALHRLGWGVELDKVVLRTLECTALVCLVIGSRWLGLNRLAQWGFVGPPRRFLRRMLSGLVFGLGSMGALVLMLYALDLRELELTLPTAGEMVRFLSIVAVGALFTALIEESLFRGGLHSFFSSGLGLAGPLLVGGALFAGAHFLDAGRYEDVVDWSAGFDVLWASLDGFRGTAWIDSFVALFVAALLLSVFRWRTGDIAFAIGIHIGWIVVIRMTKRLTSLDRKSDLAVWVGNYDGVIGYAGAIWFLALSCAVLAAFRYSQNLIEIGKPNAA